MLFLHSGFSRGFLAFSAQILPFSGGYRCLYPDFRGHGRPILGQRLLTGKRIRTCPMILDFLLGNEVISEIAETRRLPHKSQ